jgi:hypothetical protein
MMLHTKHRYDAYAYHREEPEPRFLGGFPEWPLIDDRLRASWLVRIGWGALYSVPYFFFATHWWLWMLLPLQWVMGPIHGAIVNWAGHKYGYQNFDNGDRLAQHAGRRRAHHGRALPEQSPQVRDEPQLRGAVVRDGPHLAGHATAGPGRG